MFARNLPSMIIVLIVANPVFCQIRGFCEGAPSCDCEECRCSWGCEGTADCQEQPAPCENQKAPAEPCDCPDGSYCQCLRAGAVIKAGPLPIDAHEGFAFDRITVILPVARPTFRSVSDRFGECLPRGKANPGRIARCLRMSFLC